jgi:catechol 2,3-dioxygenase-like lactoylglutathione lyase family enzyme
MPIRNAIASLAVRDLDVSLAWYERLLGRPADSRPMAELGEWKFERGGWLQVYQGTERAGSGSVTLAVTRLEEQISAIRDADMDPGEPIISEKVKVVMIKDPDGNSIAFAEALDPTIAQ